MTTYNTGNPVPSGDARDRFDNSQTLDQIVNGLQDYYQNRIGGSVLSLKGMANLFDQFLTDSAYQSIGSYAAGLTFTSHNQYVLFEGLPYALSMTVATPYTTTGVWAVDSQNLVLIGDNAVRQGLAELQAQVSGMIGEVTAQADRAEAARDAAQLRAGLFLSISEGLAGTVSGDLFSVPDPASEEYLVLYKNDGGVPLKIVSYPSSEVVRRLERGEFNGFKLQSLPPESGFAFAITDAWGAAVFMIDLDGKVSIPGYEVERDNLSAELSALTPQFLPPETGYVLAFVDPVTGKAPVRLTVSGVLEADELSIGFLNVQTSWLSAPIQRMALPQLADVQPVAANVWRMKEGAVAVRLDTGAGSWRQFPSVRTRLLWGDNSTGINLEARRSAGLCILGMAKGADFTPGAYPSITFKGSITTTLVNTPVGSYQAGDYLRYSSGTWVLSAGEFTGMTTGDLLVFDGSAWHIQPAPNRYRFTAEKTWYAVTAQGWFDGISLSVGDRLMYVSTRQGGVAAQLWYKLSKSKGDLAYAGEFAPTAGLPAAPVDGVVYQSSASGTAGGYTFAANDYAVFSGGTWAQIPNDPPISIPAGGSAALKCVNDANEWEVRRADKSSAGVGADGSLTLKAQVQSEPKSTQDRIVCMSDSMFFVGGVGDTVIQESGRDGVVMAYSASKSWQVLGTLEYDIATAANVAQASILVAWHGENNSTTAADAVSIRDCSLRMADLIGARDRKLLFLSVLGRRNCTFDGTRLVVPAQEDQRAGVGFHAELNKWYAATFPGQWLSPLTVLLSAATDALDPTFPGMTEKQVAAKYGIAPWSFFGSASLAYPVSSLSFQGYWGTAGLPTGGSDKHYYLRSDNGVIGNLLINTAGVWSEKTIDAVHLSQVGGVALALGGAGFALGGEYPPVPANPGIVGFLNGRFI